MIPTLNPHTTSLLTASALHVPERTAQELNDAESELAMNLAVDVLHHGWLIYVSEDQENGAIAAGHPELAKLIDLAHRHDCEWLILACDANPLPEVFHLPLFQWSA